MMSLQSVQFGLHKVCVARERAESSAVNYAFLQELEATVPPIISLVYGRKQKVSMIPVYSLFFPGFLGEPLAAL